jgi:hypothetical protein
VALAAGERLGDRVAGQRVGEHAVDDQSLVGEPKVGELAAGSRRFRQGGPFRAGDEHERRGVGVGEHGDGPLVHGALALQAGERPEARVLLRVGGQVAGPGGGQFEQPQRVTGGCGVEHHVVVAAGGRRLGQEAGERVERCDLHGAGAGQLLFHGRELGCGDRLPVGGDDALAVGVSGRLGFEVHQVEPADRRRRRRFLAGVDLEHVGEVRRRVGADEQHPVASVRERDGDGAGDGGLADPAFAGEQHEAGVPARPVQRGQAGGCVHVVCASVRRG